MHVRQQRENSETNGHIIEASVLMDSGRIAFRDMANPDDRWIVVDPDDTVRIKQ